MNYEKYLKYKSKYLFLKGGSLLSDANLYDDSEDDSDDDSEVTKQITDIRKDVYTPYVMLLRKDTLEKKGNTLEVIYFNVNSIILIEDSSNMTQDNKKFRQPFILTENDGKYNLYVNSVNEINEIFTNLDFERKYASSSLLNQQCTFAIYKMKELTPNDPEIEYHYLFNENKLLKECKKFGIKENYPKILFYTVSKPQ